MGAVFAADDGDLPIQATGDATEGFDPGETKILPAGMKSVGPGVFNIVEKNIASLSPPTPP